MLGNEGLYSVADRPVACYSVTMMNTKQYDTSGKYTNYERGGIICLIEKLTTQA